MKKLLPFLTLCLILLFVSCNNQKYESLELKNKQLEQRIDTLKNSVDFLFRVVAKIDRNTPEYKHWVDSLRKAEETKKVAEIETLKSLEQSKDKK